MQFDPFKTKLPITEVIVDLKAKLAEVNTVILEAPPGAGKSTLIPLILKDEPWLKDKKILMLEPRRLAVKTIAERMSSLLGEEVGNTIGYRIRFESRSNENTKVEIITEGILTRMLQNDNALENIGLIIFDEFHERNIHSDLALALTRESQNILRPDLKILVMSATLNTDELTAQLEAPLISSKGREYPITVNYETDYPLESIAESAAFLAKKVLNIEQEGDILIFLPGEREIKRCVEVLKSFKMDIVIRELFGRLTLNKQRAAILKDRNNKRKVVVATSIAETSLTIEGIKIVIDSGYTRTAEFDSKTGLSGLKTKQITKDIADQRAGRAGRLGPGIAYRMWSLSTQYKLNLHRLSEILIADLAPLKLDLVKWGIQNVNDLFWLDPPPDHALNMASELLESIDAVENNKITDHGVLIQKLPTHPRIAHLLIVAESLDLIHLATDIAALLDERDPLKNNPGIDISYRIEALRRHRKSKSLTGKFKQIERLAKQYRSLFNLEESNDSFDPFDAGILLIHAYPERIAFARPGNNAQFQLANGKYVSIGHKDSLAFEPWLAIAHMNAREKSGSVFLAAPLNPMDLRPFLKEIESYKWDADDGGIIAERETRIGSIVLKKTPIRELDEEKNKTITCECF